MSERTTGTLVDGVVELDEAVNLPNHSRVHVQIALADDTSVASKTAWQQMKLRLKDRPIRSGGQRFTRDELHERR